MQCSAHSAQKAQCNCKSKSQNCWPRCASNLCFICGAYGHWSKAHKMSGKRSVYQLFGLNPRLQSLAAKEICSVISNLPSTCCSSWLHNLSDTSNPHFLCTLKKSNTAFHVRWVLHCQKVWDQSPLGVNSLWESNQHSAFCQAFRAICCGINCCEFTSQDYMQSAGRKDVQPGGSYRFQTGGSVAQGEDYVSPVFAESEEGSHESTAPKCSASHPGREHTSRTSLQSCYDLIAFIDYSWGTNLNLFFV